MDVSQLIAALQANVEQLEQLTGGQIDAITDQQGRPFLLQRAQEQMRRNEAAQRNAMLNALPAHIAMLDRDGIIMSVNDAWRSCARMSAVQAPGHEVGKNYLQLCEQEGGEGAAEAKVIAAGIRAVLRGQTPNCSFEYACMSQDVHFCFLLTVTPLAALSGHGAVVMHMDITERKRGEEELRRFRTAMDCTADAIFLIRRASMRFVEVNATACTMLGYTRDELLQLGPVPISTAQPVQHAALYDRLTEKGGNECGEIQLRRKDGSLLQVEIHRQALQSGPDWIIVGVVRDITERRQAQQQLQHLAHHDGLTGLPNRTLFYDILTKMLEQAEQNGWVIAVLFLDLDNFKSVNDTLGHSFGDELLVQFSNRLLECVRVRDAVGRLGGDEFAVVVLIKEGPNTAAAVANKIRDLLRAPFTLGGHEVRVTASIGITMYPADASLPDELIKYADTAMYRAKQAGRDTFRFFTAQMNTDVLNRLELEVALRKAFENEEFVLHYQPKVLLASGRITGLEALLRWERPGHGLVSPALFIPMLEETGLIVGVGSWVIATACRQIGQWLQSPIGAVSVSVNVAGRQFLEGDVQSDVVTALEVNGVPAELLELELTESSMMANVEKTISTLQSLKRLGVKISIDDFGTGYSSLAYLRRFPIDMLKIDIAFIREVTSNPDDAAIALAILSMAHSLKLQVVAEGVETSAQVAFLIRHHCDQIQGYFFSRPLAASAVEQLLLEDLRLRLPPGPLPQKTLLLVDDDPNILSSLHRLLRADGYRILCAGSAAEGFELLAQHAVQVILCDQRMPNMNGTEFLDRVKEIYPDTFRIILSGYTDLETIVQAVNHSAIYRFFTKPWDSNVLRKELRAAFQHYCLLYDVVLSGVDGALPDAPIEAPGSAIRHQPR
ncbi:EAL domain-containing protein [Chitinimonas arctica]|uniref:EAL domain-containing protein n=1 Tax=Chitinimonas arctica TaxID=2594795 RepID=A0A516SEH3_9NEIS|nr:EAL domain-containing protein [Chitinimonas arctica]QDQ26551.1 EAL domain-containing protein [Chitinimonas arctica]